MNQQEIFNGILAGIQHYLNNFYEKQSNCAKQDGEEILEEARNKHPAWETDKENLMKTAFLIRVGNYLCAAVDTDGELYNIKPFFNFRQDEFVFEPSQIIIKFELFDNFEFQFQLFQYFPVHDSSQALWREAIDDFDLPDMPEEKRLQVAADAFLRLNEQLGGSADELSEDLKRFGDIDSHRLFQDMKVVEALFTQSDILFDITFMETVLREAYENIKKRAEEEEDQVEVDDDDENGYEDEDESEDADLESGKSLHPREHSLTAAVTDNDPEAVRALLRSGADINEVDPSGATALLVAVKDRNEELVDLLLNFGADPGQPSNDGILPLLVAVRFRNEHIVKSLVNAGADVNGRSNFPHDEHTLEGCTPLWGAAVTGDIQMCRFLLKHGADLDVMNNICMTPLSVAITTRNDEMIDLFLKQGAKVDFDIPPAEPTLLSESTGLGGVTPLYFAVANQDISTIKKLLKRGSDVNRIGRNCFSPLQCAVDNEYLDVVKILLKAGADPNFQSGWGRTALMIAVAHQNIDIVRLLLTQKADPNLADEQGETALLAAIDAQSEELVKLLVKHGADIEQPDNKGVRPVLLAVFIDNENLVKVLLGAGADVNGTSTFPHEEIAVGGCTALWGAAATGNLQMCRLLLKHGADLNAMNDICATPLSIAINNGHDEIIDFLLKQGARVDFEIPPAETIQLENFDELGGVTPLYIAVGNQDIGTIKKLLKRGANVNRTGRNGFTPLKRAAYMGYLDVVKILLKAGADPNIADHDNFTPLMNATAQEHTDIVKVLLKHGADPNVQSKWRESSFFATSGKTALMDAAADGNVDIARLLLAHKADPNLMNEGGETALHAAVKSEHTDMVNLLLRSGSDPDVYGSAAGSAMELALRSLVEKDEDEREGNIVDILKLLFKQGAPKARESIADIVDRVAEDTDGNIQQLLSVHGIKLPRA